jgi:uncharacterized membrane protein YeaQ/YmgE (transglycosylase-associated protein family)
MLAARGREYVLVWEIAARETARGTVLVSMAVSSLFRGAHSASGESQIPPRGDRMDIIITLIIGGIIGWVGSLIMKTDAQMGLIANIVVGIVGSFLGFWIAGQLGFAENQAIVRWLIAIGGAVLLIAILKALNIFK